MIGKEENLSKVARGHAESARPRISDAVRAQTSGPASRYALVAGIIIIWQIGASLHLWNTVALPSPLSIAQALAQWYSNETLIADIGVSLERIATGFGLAAILGVGLGVGLGRYPALARQFIPVVDLLRPIPPIAWIPLVIFWLGISDRATVFVVLIGSFFPIFTGTYSGMTSVPRDLVNTSLSLGIRGLLLTFHVLMPAALPAIFLGLRSGLGMGWMSLIAAELVGAQSGLGYEIQVSGLSLDTATILAGMLVIGLLGALMNYLLLVAARRLMPWDEASRAGIRGRGYLDVRSN